jgi:hypothetical protein
MLGLGVPGQVSPDPRPHAIAPGCQLGVHGPDGVEDDAAQPNSPLLMDDGPGSPADDRLDEVRRGGI